MNKVSKLIFLAGICFIILLVQGCASQRSFSESFPSRLVEAQQERYFKSQSLARNLFNNTPPPVLSQGMVLTPEDIMARLLYVSPLRGHRIPIVVINDPKVNAQTDGNSIYINTGFINVFGANTDMVASVFAHELGHILAKHQPHGSRGSSSANYIGLFTPAFSLLPYGGIYGGVTTTAIQEGIKMREFSYSRHQENEADAIGAWIATRAGFNPIGLSEFLDVVGGTGYGAPQTISIPTSLSGIPQSAAVTLLSSSPLYKTHPPSKERKKNVELMIKRNRGEITYEQMRKESKWLADIYYELEMRSPK